MDNDQAKKDIIEKIKNSTNILVTVSNDPSVDALSATLGLALLIDKLDKHATAVFSGSIPPAISFLEPEKTFENTTNSLRDFIIALDKEKADHLKYKVEGDSVKIFITPYRTTITSDDLDFSQGDYNVELVIALGVDNQNHLDAALDSHGRILHDATTVTLTAGEQTSELGSIDWHDAGASSLSEMVANMADGLKKDAKDKTLLDAQVSTALLTGIVAETDRFSNPRTTSKVMTTAAQLMAAGADQQLIAAKLSETHEIHDAPASEPVSTKIKKTSSNDGGLDISHDASPDDASEDDEETLAEMEARVRADEKAEEEQEKHEEPVAESNSEPEVVSPGPEPTHAYGITEDTTPVHAEVADSSAEEPSMGGTLSATADQAADDARREQENDQNKTILSHSYLGGSTAPAAAQESGSSHDLLGAGPEPGSPYAFTPDPVTTEPAPVEQPVVAAAPAFVAPQPISAPAPPPAPVDLGLPMPPPLPDFSAVNTGGVTYAPGPLTVQPLVQPERLGDILAPEPSPAPAPFTPPEPAPPSNDPGQFKIPGQ